MSGPRRSIAAHAGFALVQTIVPPALSVLLVPVLLNGLGTVEYGLLATLIAAFGLGALLDLGLSKSVTRFTATFVAEGRSQDVTRLASTAVGLYMALGVAVFAVAALFGALGLGLVGVPEDLRGEGFAACLVFGAATAFNLPAGVLGGVMTGLRRHDAESALNVAVAVASAAGMALAAIFGGGVAVVIAAFYAPQLVKPWIRLPLIRQTLPGFGLSRAEFDPGLVRELGGYSIWSFLVDAGSRIQDSLDPIVVAAALGVAAVAPYNVGLQMGRILVRMTIPIGLVLLPLGAELRASGDRERSRRVVLRATRYAAAAAVAVAGPLIAMASDVVRVWTRQDLTTAVEIGQIFLGVSILIVARAPLLSTIEASTKGVRAAGVLLLSETVLNIALSIALVGPLGARGVAIATAISVSVVTVLGIVPATQRFLAIGPLAILSRSLAPVLLSLLVGIPVWIGLELLVSGRGLGWVVLALLVGTGAYAACALGIDVAERGSLPWQAARRQR